MTIYTCEPSEWRLLTCGMASKPISKLSDEELRDRWRSHIEWIGDEVNHISRHRIRYRLIEKWLFRSNNHGWFNRHLQVWVDQQAMVYRRTHVCSSSAGRSIRLRQLETPSARD